MQALDLTGQQYGSLTVIKLGLEHRTTGGRCIRRWWCECVCGKSTLVRVDKLRSGYTTSCGCIQHEMRTNFGDLNRGKHEDHPSYIDGRNSDPEHRKKLNHNSYLRNYDKVRARNRQWAIDHPARMRAFSRKFRDTHRIEEYLRHLRTRIAAKESQIASLLGSE